MMKFSSTAVLLVLAPLIAGSSWPGRLIPQRDPVKAHAAVVSARLLPLVRVTPPPAAAAILRNSDAAGDVWLTVFLGGALVALQLRRQQKNARMSRLC
jgi:hypothetical protein